MTDVAPTLLLPLLGGSVLGLASAAVYAQGHVLVVSGAVGGLFASGGARQAWRWVFLGGLLSGGAVAATVHPGAFPPLPASFSLTRAVTGGFAVGAGAALGGGCTSGHGVSGLSRLSPRSAVFIGVAMAAGWAAATLTHAAKVNPQVANAAPVPTALFHIAAAALAALLTAPAAGSAATKGNPCGRRPVQLGLWGGAGFTFVLGLAISGMTSTANVVAFLSGPLSKAFDPSLMAVMAGAIGSALPPFQTAQSWRWLRRTGAVNPQPVPPSNNITVRLLMGATLFGAGWGATGLCPGPALVNLARPTTQVVAAVAAMFGGMATAKRLAF